MRIPADIRADTLKADKHCTYTRIADKIANMRNFDELEDSAGTEAASAAACTDPVPKGTRTVQADSVSDADSESRHKECPLFISAGAYSGGR